MEYILACARRVAPRRLCVEFRNHTWMTGDNQHETLDFLAGNGLPYVCVDMPQGYPSSIPPVLAATSDLAVVRMHGHSRAWTSKDIAEKFGYRYGDDELAGLAPIASAAWPGRPTSPTWCSTTATATGRTSTRSSSPGFSLLPHLPLDPAQHPDHAAHPQRADRLGQPDPVRVRRPGGEHLLAPQPVQARRAGCRRSRGWSAPRAGASKNRCTTLVRPDLDGEEQRRLALATRSSRSAVRRRSAPGSGGQLVAENSSSSCSRSLSGMAREVLGDLGEPGMQGARRAHVAGRGPGLSPAGRSGRARRCPTRSTSRRSCGRSSKPSRCVQHEPGVARPLADAAVGDDVVVAGSGPARRR